MITQKLRKKLLFYLTLDINPKQMNHFPQCYQKIFGKWSRNLSVSPSIPSTTTSQAIWFDKPVKIDNKSLYNRRLANQVINHARQIFMKHGMRKSCSDIKTLIIDK